MHIFITIVLLLHCFILVLLLPLCSSLCWMQIWSQMASEISLQPFIPMDLELSYHPQCWGQFNPLSPTHFVINHLYGETNFIMYKQNPLCFTKIWEEMHLSQTLTSQFEAIVHVSCKFGWWDGSLVISLNANFETFLV